MKIARIFAQLQAAALLGIVGLLPFNTFLVTWGGTAIGPLLVWKSWKEALLLVLGLGAAVVLGRYPKIARQLWQPWYNRLAVAYTVVTLVFGVISPFATKAVVAGLAMNLRFVAIFLLVQIALAALPDKAAQVRRTMQRCVLAGAAVVAVLAIIQVAWLPKEFLAIFGYDKNNTVAPYVLVDDNPDAVRAFATLNGPNDLGAFLILPICVMIGLIALRRKPVMATAALSAMVLALVLSGSRSAWLGVIAAIVCLVLLAVPRQRIRRLVIWGALPTVVVMSIGLWLAVQVPAIRLAVFHSSPGDPSLFEGSTQQHWEATARGVAEFISHPLGQGVGAAGPASYYRTYPVIPENYYVQIALETGVIGLALFVSLCVMLAMALWRVRFDVWARSLLASFAGLFIVNMLLHGWADDTVAMTWWALAGAVVITSEKGANGRKTANKKAARAT